MQVGGHLWHNRCCICIVYIVMEVNVLFSDVMGSDHLKVCCPSSKTPRFPPQISTVTVRKILLSGSYMTDSDSSVHNNNHSNDRNLKESS